jgi:ribonuclease HII
MIGIDEVGRGAWAGPLLVCAVRLHDQIDGLKDSKKLSAKKRQALNAQILPLADIGYGWISAKQIDEFGLSKALKMASAIALTQIEPLKNEKIIIDGSVNFAPQYKAAKTVIRADDLYPVVSAASIVAKVARDAYMAKLSKEQPCYAFEKHAGYGTVLHFESIQQFGLCNEHRQSFKLPI